MKLEKFTGHGSTDARRRFWNNVADTVLSLQKREGKNVSVREDDTGSLVSVNPQRQGQATSTCPPPNPCTLDLSFTSDVYTVTQTALPINPNVCETLGWNGIWETNCANDTCSHVTNFCVDIGSPSCVCGVRLEWIEDVGAPDPARVRIVLGHIQDDGVLADGWYLWATAQWENNPPTTVCHWETSVCTSFPCTCVYLGADDVFDTELSVSIPMPADPINPGGCGGDATLDLTFHPCT